jgi:hypothetical protein
LASDTAEALEVQLTLDGNWSGNTAQGEVIQFRVENDQIVEFSVGFRIVGCESASPFSIISGLIAPVESDAFVIDNAFANVTGSFVSFNEADGSIDINCQIGLTTTWTASKGVQALRTPAAEEMTRFPLLEVPDHLISREAGSDNFDELTGVVGASGDWFLVSNFSDSVLPIPSGWSSVSDVNGAAYYFGGEESIEEYIINVRVFCRDELPIGKEFTSTENSLRGYPTVEILSKSLIDDQFAYLLWRVVGEENPPKTYIRLAFWSASIEGCLYRSTAQSQEKNWEGFYPIARAAIANWFDFSNKLIGMTLPESLLTE